MADTKEDDQREAHVRKIELLTSNSVCQNIFDSDPAAAMGVIHSMVSQGWRGKSSSVPGWLPIVLKSDSYQRVAALDDALSALAPTFTNPPKDLSLVEKGLNGLREETGVKLFSACVRLRFIVTWLAAQPPNAIEPLLSRSKLGDASAVDGVAGACCEIWKRYAGRALDPEIDGGGGVTSSLSSGNQQTDNESELSLLCPYLACMAASKLMELVFTHTMWASTCFTSMTSSTDVKEALIRHGSRDVPLWVGLQTHEGLSSCFSPASAK
eukprot:CAMPEP_0185769142 /NCGR_PEP_ID=MMETSP1174-20130828/53401_1 /TAXON_ID=35687 /ORGANISM="Dictyocha speculum, Strain CCMP1381" /LENGTH=267 /DNA_ID=CAMNT_0028454111 /DNA_START=18 /DNA_END=821 /DNA_ORIENTATION=+